MENNKENTENAYPSLETDIILYVFNADGRRACVPIRTGSTIQFHSAAATKPKQMDDKSPTAEIKKN
mgnify:CR=1 FL=1